MLNDEGSDVVRPVTKGLVLTRRDADEACDHLTGVG